MLLLTEFGWAIASVAVIIILWLASAIILMKSWRMANDCNKKRGEIFDEWRSRQVDKSNLLPKAEELVLIVKDNCKSIMLGAAFYLVGGLLFELTFGNNFFDWFSVLYFLFLCLWAYILKAQAESLKKILAGEED